MSTFKTWQLILGCAVAFLLSLSISMHIAKIGSGKFNVGDTVMVRSFSCQAKIIKEFGYVDHMKVYEVLIDGELLLKITEKGLCEIGETMMNEPLPFKGN